ncbi:M23 family metallopeptidase [Prauserella sp. ASG 168]|uniref:M23 family metallopeptidase n=1 Tax=Prauserella cavernicola TaxID=2800127 RepID=A0A934V7G7_9PSEU|nr:M23 family metallopeptidase [Prauserella cavernicola]
MGADDPRDLLARSSLLNAVSDSGLDALGSVQRAVTGKANADAEARAVRQEADQKERAAVQAGIEADRAYRAAVADEAAAQRHSAELLDRKQALDTEFAEAQQALAVLEGQRRDYTTWQARKQAEQAAAQAGPPASSPAGPRPAPVRTQSSAGVVAPTSGVITSTYGPRWGVIHYGLDIANSIGTPIVSVSDGVVISSGPASGFGLWVRVRHDTGIVTVYGHINESLVSVGQRVSAGQQIATMGNRGQSTGPHLHLEVQKNGSKIDPLFWLRANGVYL